MSALPERDRRRFDNVGAWVFDLDNTLYPRHTNIYAQVDGRIHDYVQRLLNLPHDEAQRLQKDYYRRYGTTLRGLMIEHGVTPDDFLEYVHDIDHSPIVPDPQLGAAIERLPGRKFILTNGSRRHAESVAERLGITRHFEEIFDIVWSELLPKPNRGDIRPLYCGDRRRAAQGSHVRGPVAKPRGAACPWHGDRARRAGGHPCRTVGGVGDGGSRRAVRRSRH